MTIKEIEKQIDKIKSLEYVLYKYNDFVDTLKDLYNIKKVIKSGEYRPSPLILNTDNKRYSVYLSQDNLLYIINNEIETITQEFEYFKKSNDID